MHAFILGVPGRYRGAALESQLAASGIECEFVAGPDASRWTGDDLTRVYSPRAAQIALHRQLAAGEVACALGHQSMVRSLLARGDEWGLLLEDDARIVRPLAPLVGALPGLSDEPIVVQLGSHRAAVAEGNPLVFDGGRLWRQPRRVFGSHAYLMNRRAALIAERAYRGRRVESTSDWPFSWASRVQFWRPEADIARPDRDVESLIQADRRAVRTTAHRSRPAVADMTIGLLQVAGVAAVYGRWQGLPLRILYRRDRAEGIRRLRRRNGPSAADVRERS